MIFTTSKSLCDNDMHGIFAANLRSRFGNFIGEEAESEVASEVGVDAGDYVYDDEPEEADGVTGQELMEIDGMFMTLKLSHCCCDADLRHLQMDLRMLSSFTKTNNTTPLPSKFMAPTSRPE